MSIDLALASSVYVYNQKTGVITYKVTRSGPAIAGRVATHKRSDGYLGLRLNGKHYLAHRIAWLLVFGKFPTFGIDHVNGDNSDNRFCNLRMATDLQNNQNRRRANKNSSSPLIGASFHKRSGKWVAQIRTGGKNKWLGSYKTAKEAHDAYVSAKREAHQFCTI